MGRDKAARRGSWEPYELRGRVDRLQAELARSNAANRTLASDLQRANEQHANLSQRIQRGEERTNRLVNELAKSNTAHASLSRDLQKLSNEDAALRNENAALKDENAALKDENAALKDENAALKDENATSKQRLQRRDERVTELLQEKYMREDSMRQARTEGQLPRTFGDQASPANVASSQAGQTSAARKPGAIFLENPGFAEACKGPNIDDMAAVEEVATTALHRLCKAWGPTDNQPTMLIDLPWVLSKIPEYEGPDYESVPAKAPKAAVEEDARPLKRRRTEPTTTPPLDRRDSVAATEEVTFSRNHDLHRASMSGLGVSPDYQRPPARRSVCVHCWVTGGTCNGEAECRSCIRAGVRCVRKLCDGGKDCLIWRCPCLHPGQWDERDRRWTVEEGMMPRQRR